VDRTKGYHVNQARHRKTNTICLIHLWRLKYQPYRRNWNSFWRLVTGRVGRHRGEKELDRRN
jgi:hypothetical protein